jgi:putative ABC transport system permease protein
MFFFTYLRRELRSRMRQAVFIALGLALGVGLVVTVAAASSGVNQAQASVLGALYGVGTDVTVTGPVPGPIQGSHAQNLTIGPNGPEICTNGKCHSLAGQTTSNVLPSYSAISEPKVAQVAHLRGVRAAVGVLSVGILSATFPKAGSNGVPQTSSISIDGIDTGHLSVGPLSSATLTSGHAFTAADSNSAVAVVDSGYATSNRLKVGSALTIAQVKYTVIGIVRQPQQGGSPTDVYIPLARAQAIPTPSGTQKNDVNTIYVSAASAADISAVQREISGLLPGTTVTTASSVAKEVTGAISGASKLANDLGRWLSVLVLIAAFVVAMLLTMAAVARRAREFGTLKAIGWRSRRIITQVLGESAVMGIAGAAAGIGLGYAGTAIIAAIAPKLSASVPLNNGAGVARTEQVGPGALSGGFSSLGGPTAHVVSVPLHPSVSAGVIGLAVILAVAGGLLAGGVGSWRIAGLRPADALARVA